LDNRLAEEADWDLDILKQEFSELQGIADFDLSITGFTDNEISKALTFDASKLRTPYDYLPDHPSEKPVSRAGDIWLLDNHRIMCGDATKWQDLKQLLIGKKANLIFIDPPYNVNYTGRRAKRVSIAGDDSPTAEFTEFLQKAFDNCAKSLQQDGSLYICFPGSNLLEFQQTLQNSGFAIRTQIVWVKNHFVLNWGRYNIQHEPILYCYLKGQTDAWYVDNTQSTVWQIDKPLANPLHPTMKPVALIQRAIINSSKLHDIVLDPFAGSGSTLIACETLKRTAYLLELMPHYVDTIIRRWEEHTKKTAFLIDGRTFAAVKGERHGKTD
jgi:DNA modification methylase